MKEKIILIIIFISAINFLIVGINNNNLIYSGISGFLFALFIILLKGDK